jgi:hypothetical protein
MPIRRSRHERRAEQAEVSLVERYQKAYGYWRPVMRSSIDKFMKPVVSLSKHASRFRSQVIRH